MVSSKYFADRRFKQTRIDEQLKNCELGLHDWSNWCSVPSGLARECRACHKVEHHPDYGPESEEEIILSKTDLDKKKTEQEILNRDAALQEQGATD